MINRAVELSNNAWRRLGGQWLGLSELWDDGVRRRFERDFFQEFNDIAPKYLREIERLAGTIHDVRRKVP